MYKKMVILEPIQLIPSAEKKLEDYAKEVVWYHDIPENDQEKIQRIGDADALLLSYTSTLSAKVIEACPNLKYIGMCCSLYAPESANVDVVYARQKGIVVCGVRDYGDQGVVEYVLSELIRYLHGFGGAMWKDQAEEITNLKVGIVGLGASGLMIAEALKFLGADVSYYSRTRKSKAEQQGIHYVDFHPLLEQVDVVISCLNKNVILFDEKAFAQLGAEKIMFNTSIGVSHEMKAFKQWLALSNTAFFCDSLGALGDERLLDHPQVHCLNVSSGRTRQALIRLSEKVIENLEAQSKSSMLL